ncbi:hypothetical protein JD969_04785 [Planctomycetota bacterium]|nr:hypothetical protein JD969_04785 [Planctomycetota bacterium]
MSQDLKGNVVDLDVNCWKCGYNLNGLREDACCSGCGESVNESIAHEKQIENQQDCVDSGVTCVNCHYNLTSLKTSDECPECGVVVSFSHEYGDTIRDFGWAKKIYEGTGCGLIAMICWFGLLLVIPFYEFTNHLIFKWLGWLVELLFFGLSLIGCGFIIKSVWLLGVRNRYKKEEFRQRLTVWLMWAAFLLIVFQIGGCSIISFLRLPFSVMDVQDDAEWLSGVLSFSFILGPIWLVKVLGSVSGQIHLPEPMHVKRTHKIICNIMKLLVGYLIIGIISYLIGVFSEVYWILTVSEIVFRFDILMIVIGSTFLLGYGMLIYSLREKLKPVVLDNRVWRIK